MRGGRADSADAAGPLGEGELGGVTGGRNKCGRGYPSTRSGAVTPAAAALASSASRFSRQKRDQDS